MKSTQILTVALLSAAIVTRTILTVGEQPHTELTAFENPSCWGVAADNHDVSPPSNPYLADFTLRVIEPKEVKDWWVNTMTSRSGGFVSNWYVNACGELSLKEPVIIPSSFPNDKRECTQRVYLNELFNLGMRTYAACQAIQAQLHLRGIRTKIVKASAYANPTSPPIEIPKEGWKTLKPFAEQKNLDGTVTVLYCA